MKFEWNKDDDIFKQRRDLLQKLQQISDLWKAIDNNIYQWCIKSIQSLTSYR